MRKANSYTSDSILKTFSGMSVFFRKARFVSLLLLVVSSANTRAVSFLSFDSRSISMGGTGVVTARSHNASLFNPSLLIDRDPTRHTKLHMHTYVGLRLIDRDNFLQTTQDFRDHYQGMSVKDLLSDAIDLEDVRYSGGTELRKATARVRALQRDINQLSNKPLRVSGSYGVAFGYPVGRWSWGGYHRHYVVLGSVVRVADEDNASIDRVVGMTDRFADLIDEVITLPEYVDSPEGPTLAESVDRSERLSSRVQALDLYLNFDRLRDDVRQHLIEGKEAQDYLREPIPSEFFSTIESRGAEVTEQALSLAGNIEAGRYLAGDLRIGLTFKQVEFTTISFDQLVNQFSLSAYDDPQNRRTYQRLNMDVGLAYDLPHQFQMGLVVRNVIPYDFVTVDGAVVPMRPVARVGLGYVQRHVRLSLDVDVTRNEPLGFDSDKQYVSLGGEWFLWRNTALRAGMRANAIDGAILPSLGLGFGGRHGHFDVALAKSPNGDEWGLGLQAGLAF